MRDADKRILIERLDTQQAIRYVVEIGRPQPLYSGAGGKTILAFLPESEIDAQLAAADIGEDRKMALRAELAQIRRQGSAPIFGRDGAVVGSLNVLCVDSILTDEIAEKFGHLVRESTVEISARLGWTGSEATRSFRARHDPPGKTDVDDRASDTTCHPHPQED